MKMITKFKGYGGASKAFGARNRGRNGVTLYRLSFGSFYVQSPKKWVLTEMKSWVDKGLWDGDENTIDTSFAYWRIQNSAWEEIDSTKLDVFESSFYGVF